VYKFDIENDMELMREMGVRAVPTIKIFKEGTEVFSRPGVMQPAEVLELLN
jgi:thioredoxin-related protein